MPPVDSLRNLIQRNFSKMAVEAARRCSHITCFQSRLINKHFSPDMDACHRVTFYYICFPFFVPQPPPKKSLYYYVKLCLWKHKFAPLMRSPSPGWLGYTSPHSGWETAVIEARCAPTSCLIMFRNRIPQPDHNTAAFRNKCLTVGAWEVLLLLFFSSDQIKKSSLGI